ncbi:glycosyl transferase family 1 [Mycobacterium sp. IS-1590]|uniref:glycosyltransferase n=1 Tax=Mycobacterium sp. IS-1590 TaxID=1772286 RepID=UPI00074614FD|nr:glycosyltransferase [Mycobacterium sp. IS-1590]KUI42158.1 glycosyl transferase family 1 [Mycobacterium sp. IS-1590]
MKIVLASYGTRGEVEPGVALGRELLRRGHDVRMAVPPNLISLAESAGVAAVPYGLDTRAPLEAVRKLFTLFFRKPWRFRELRSLWLENREFGNQCWNETSTELMSLTDGADLLVTVVGPEPAAANIAEYYDIPFATLHPIPMRINGQVVPFLPAGLSRYVMTLSEWLAWRVEKKLDDPHRQQLGLQEATGPASRRIAKRGSLEIQAYDEACFPGLAAEWAKWNGQRPFVGALTLELPTVADNEVAAWIAAGKPPIYFGFGSIPVKAPAATLAMIGEACAELGERALVCAGWSDLTGIGHPDHVKVVGAVSHAEIFPACRAVVHHGGAGTTAAGLRAGVPTLILWTLGDQPLWGDRVKRLKVGTARRLSTTTRKSLVADLRTVLAPDYVTRAREFASRMTKPAESVTNAADLVENLARSRRVG